MLAFNDIVSSLYAFAKKLPSLSIIKLLPIKYASMSFVFSLPTLLHNIIGVMFSIALTLAISKVFSPPKFARIHIKLLPFSICFLDISLNHTSKQIYIDNFSLQTSNTL